MSHSTPYNYRCPNLECRAEYVAVQRSHGLMARGSAGDLVAETILQQRPEYLP
jgi:hypothetical protein